MIARHTGAVAITNGGLVGDTTSALLARLDAFLDTGDASEGTPVERVLRTPWRTLEHIESADEDVRTDLLHVYEDLAKAEDRARRDYTGRYAIELLQNAHDACGEADIVGRAWIQVSDTAVLIGNQGKAFD